MAKGSKPSARKGSSSKNRANLQAANIAVKSAQDAAKKAARLAREKQRATLKRTGTDIREFRSHIASLKKAGIVSKRTDARKQEATKYMRQKVRDFFGVIVGTEQAIPIPRSTREQYRESGVVKMKGRFAVIPKADKEQAVKIRRGDLIEVTTPVGRPGPDGKRPAFMREVILPFKLTSMQGVAERLKNDPTLDGLKNNDELFGARIFGHNIAQGLGYPSADELGEYILTKYKHLMTENADGKSVKYFRLFKFWNRISTLPESDEDTDDMPEYRRPRPDRKDEWIDKRRRERKALRKANKRANETDAQRKARLTKQRERQKSLRQKEGYKRPDYMGNKPKGK